MAKQRTKEKETCIESKMIKLQKIIERSLKGDLKEQDVEFLKKHLANKWNGIKRSDFIRACLNKGIDPQDLKHTEIGRIAPHTIPNKSVEEGWRLTLKRKDWIRRMVVSRFYHYEEYKDVVSSMNELFFLCALYYDESKGSLSNYFIRSMPKVFKEVVKNRAAVSVPITIIDEGLRYRKLRNDLTHRAKINNREEKEQMLERFRNARTILDNTARRIPLEQVFRKSKEGEKQYYPDPEVLEKVETNPEKEVIEREEKENIRRLVLEAIGNLKVRNALIVKLMARIPLGRRERSYLEKAGIEITEKVLETPTLKGVGELLGVSKERVRQLFEESKRELRKRLLRHREVREDFLRVPWPF